jgi:subtilisin family serine protease
MLIKRPILPVAHDQHSSIPQDEVMPLFINKSNWFVRFWRLAVSLIAAFSLLNIQPAAAFDNGPTQQGGDGPQIEQAVLDALTEDSQTDYIIVMADQANLEAAYQIEDWVERGQYVVDALKATARESQKDVLAVLDEQGAKYESFFAGNEIYVYGGTRSSLNAVQALGDEVAEIRAPVTITVGGQSSLVTFQDAIAAGSADAALPQSEIDATTTWGLTDVQAPTFWSTYGVSGENIIVANIDTGVQFNHPALLSAYRCQSDPNSLDCWYDPTNTCTGGVPCDNNGHGTHTMGTMVASNSTALSYTAGMAPGATWIACKGCATNDCSNVALLACADWILAPNDNAANRPHIVNNSWGGPGNNDWFRSEVVAWRAAGIFPAFSAGNEGADDYGNLVCSSLGSPGDYPESFATASHDSNGIVSDFSSRGPGAFGNSPYNKPNISAPGGGVISSYPGSSWASMNGTSMASPHTAGAVALLWSCAPQLRGQIDQTFQILQNAAADTPGDTACGVSPVSGADYAYGYGYLDVIAAGQVTCLTAQISGRVTDSVTGQPIAGATITAASGSLNFSAETDASGNYYLSVIASTYTVSAVRYAYTGQSASVSVGTGSSATRNFTLVPQTTSTLTGQVTDGSGRGGGLPASLTFTYNGLSLTVLSDMQGYYSADVLRGVTQTVEVNAIYEDYLSYQANLTVSAASETRNFSLLVNPYTCGAAHYYQTGAVTQTFSALSLPSGWSIEDNLGTGQVWTFTDTMGFTGSDGGIAIVNSDLYWRTYKTGGQDTSLLTPIYDFSNQANVYLQFDTYYYYYPLNKSEVAQVDLRVNNGAWTQLWRRTSASYEDNVSLDLSSQAGGQSAVQVRFHYYNASNEWYWMLDNVSLGGPPNCAYTDNVLFLPLTLR